MSSEESCAVVFAPFSSHIGSGFWQRKREIVLNKIGLTKELINIHGYYTNTCVLPQGSPSLFTVEYSSFNSQPQDYNNTVITSGHVVNTNTVEEFRDLDKNEFIKSRGQEFIKLLSSAEGLTKIAQNPQSLVPFFILTYGNLKNYNYKYWFAFPAISSIKIFHSSSSSTTTTTESEQGDGQIAKVEIPQETLQNAVKSSQKLVKTGFFLVSENNKENGIEFHSLDKDDQMDKETFYYGFLDTSTLKGHPAWVLRNYVAYIVTKNKLKSGQELKVGGIRILTKNEVQLTIYRLRVEFPDDYLENPHFVGWERNANGKLGPRAVDLTSSMDPQSLSESSVDFNLKLMKWRLFPSFDLDRVHGLKCLLLGAGTLGCNVARCLLAWGVRHIKFVDNSTVSYSNPVRQSLFTFADCLGNKPKAVAAAEALKQIYPGAESSGERIMVPMPGHPVSLATLSQVTDDYKVLEKCVEEADVLFLLMDTREARWLPSVMGAAENKTVINAALGFDSYMVMRHGDSTNRLGCYFCTDVVAPGDSTRDRTMDQQCTVTRPGVSYIASALAVELLISSLHQNHTDSPLGVTPHTVRGFLSSGEVIMPSFGSFDKCTACSTTIINEYKERKLNFVLDVMNDSSILERVSGLDKLKEEDLLDGIVEFDEGDEFDE